MDPIHTTGQAQHQHEIDVIPADACSENAEAIVLQVYTL